MSASLVGSEMCIRDRALFGSPPERERMKVLGTARNCENPLEALEAPVSYTHLTLPTICSV
eukprot:4952662-Alexandrium_andersonii.AAC.1